ncbi:TetR/AcrR family transcriptional regulator [Cohaesibacter celericrescens]|uniref:HTH tetR-type domain-containing protein n=1 Tax=Cohaesibacter celericrescens TaxID=2067669 RepID=A0A2N5XK85_9HYPH|nr:helix-turn-helix domain-containing protein [Cohaesibacter celericrescens]PLW74921.1 hypothetical protein C0081_21675 [Cohaesibacter celericrescens]
MIDTKTKIIVAALEAFKRYSIQRTTMADIASEAKLSRQTLYATLGSKEEVVAEVIGYASMDSLQATKTRLVECKSLSEQLDVFFEETIVIPYEYIQKNASCIDIWGNNEIVGHRAVVEARQAYYLFISQLLLPYTTKLGEAGQSPAEFAKFILFVCEQLKTAPNPREIFDAHLRSLKVTIMIMALGRDQYTPD